MRQQAGPSNATGHVQGMLCASRRQDAPRCTRAQVTRTMDGLGHTLQAHASPVGHFHLHPNQWCNLGNCPMSVSASVSGRVGVHVNTTSACCRSNPYQSSSTLHYRLQATHLHARVVCMLETCSWGRVREAAACSLLITHCAQAMGAPNMDTLPSREPWLARLPRVLWVRACTARLHQMCTGDAEEATGGGHVASSSAADSTQQQGASGRQALCSLLQSAPGVLWVCI